MKTKIEKLPQSKLKIEITVEAQDFDTYLKEAYKNIGREMKLDGFRSGKIPNSLVDQKVGQKAVLQEASDLAMRGTYLQALEQEKIESLGRPEVKILKLAPGNDFVYQVETHIFPEVELADYHKIGEKLKSYKGPEVKIEAAELRRAFDFLVNSRASFVTVKRPAKAGDRVEVDFVVSQNGREIENGSSKNHPLILGQGRMVPGFEKELQGLKQGEEKRFSLSFPADYHVKELAGQKADFDVKVNLVQAKKTPELNDEFAKSLGNFKNLAELKESVRQGLKQEKQQKQKEEKRIALIKKIAEESKFEIPEILVEGELEKMMEEFKNEITRLGMEFNKYLQSLQKTEVDLKKEWRDKAQERVEVAVVLGAIARKEKIEPTEAEIEQQAAKILQSFGSVKEAESRVDTDQLREYTKGVLKNEKVFQLLENKKIKPNIKE